MMVLQAQGWCGLTASQALGRHEDDDITGSGRTMVLRAWRQHVVNEFASSRTARGR
jgi:hypothetical protein